MSVPPGLTEAVMILAPPGGPFNETVVGKADLFLHEVERMASYLACSVRSIRLC